MDWKGIKIHFLVSIEQRMAFYVQNEDVSAPDGTCGASQRIYSHIHALSLVQTKTLSHY